MMKGIKGCILLVAMLLFNLVTKAEINYGLSIDWMCAKADVIVKVVITDVLVYRNARPYECGANLLEVIKGKVSTEGLNFNADNFPNSNYHLENDTVLLFLRVDTSSIGGFSLDNHGLVVGNDPYMYSAIDVNHNTQMVLTANFKALTSGAEILEYIKKVVRLYPASNQYVAVNIYIPADTEAYKYLWAGSACWLIVPKIKIDSDPRPERPDIKKP